MGNEQLGNIVLRLLVDNKAFAEGLKTSLQLVAITSTQIKDLNTFKIGAPDFSALDLSLDLSNKKIKDLISTEQLSGKELQVSGQGLDEAAAKGKKHAEAVSDGEKAVRGFRSEQRLQDYVVRQSRDSLLGITSVLALVTSGHGSATLATKRLEDSLVTGIGASEQMEFALFGLGQASNRVGGGVGVLISKIAGLAGPIAIAVGVGAALVAFFKQANEESRKAAEEGINSFVESLGGLGPSRYEDMLARTKAVIEKTKAEIAANQRIVETEAGVQTVTIDVALGKKLTERLSMLEEIKTKLDDQVKKYKEQYEVAKLISQSLDYHKNELQAIDAQLAQLNDLRAKGILVDKDGMQVADLILHLEERKRDLLKSQLDQAKDNVALAEQQLALGQITVEQYLQQLRHLASMQSTRQAELETEQKIRTVIEQQGALEAQRVEARKKGAESQEVAIDKLYQIEHDAALAVITNKFDRERTLEEERFTKVMSDIADADAAYPDMEERKRAEDAATAEHRMHLVDIERQKEEATFALRKVMATSAYEAELMDIEEKYANEEKKARELYAGSSRLEEVLAQLRKRKAAEITNAEMNRFQTGLSAAQTVVQNMGVIARWGLGEAGGQFLKDLETGLSVVQAIVATIEAMKTISTFLGFAGGGYTGSFPASMPAGVVHGGEVVFEAPIVRNNLPALMALRRVMQKGVSLSALVPGFAEGGFVIPPLSPEWQAKVDAAHNMIFTSGRAPQSLIDQWYGSMGGGAGSLQGVSIIVDRLDRLEDAIRDMKPQVNISGTLSTQKFVRKTGPAWDSFKRDKEG